MPAIHAAAYGAPGDKREILFMALDHLVRALPGAAPEVVELPASAPLGEIIVDADRCTLCVSCATVCPRGAVTAEEGRPALVFFEARCVQCGLCEQACPEHAITLGPRLVTDRERRDRRRVLHEEAPFECIRCGKPFATRSSIEGVLARLEGHAMFDGEQQRQRLKMCGDCRVIDMMQEGGPM
jgi:ferredoxin